MHFLHSLGSILTRVTRLKSLSIPNWSRVPINTWVESGKCRSMSCQRTLVLRRDSNRGPSDRTVRRRIHSTTTLLQTMEVLTTWEHIQCQHLKSFYCMPANLSKQTLGIPLGKIRNTFILNTFYTEVLTTERNLGSITLVWGPKSRNSSSKIGMIGRYAIGKPISYGWTADKVWLSPRIILTFDSQTDHLDLYPLQYFVKFLYMSGNITCIAVPITRPAYVSTFLSFLFS